ncbi:glycosyltransferase family 4 protein [Polynucleobacter paneuropaeus]|nr:glycosyltransferase family 4 protein [Polynucleobacter paneuropaeus]
MSKQHLTFVVNHVAFFISHRLPIALGAIAKGYKASLLTGRAGSESMETEALVKLKLTNIAHDRAVFGSSSLNPAIELYGLLQMFWILRKTRPSILHCVSPKGVLYGGLMARILNTKALVIAVSGMGFIFTQTGNKKSHIFTIAAYLYKTVLSFILRHRNLIVIVQNQDDRNFLLSSFNLPENKIRLICGSGVNLDQFIHYPIEGKSEIVVFPARLIKAKGVIEFIEAAKVLRQSYPDWRFILAGSADYKNPSIISSDHLRVAVEQGAVEWVGHIEDIGPLLGETSIVCLPSYREGMPKALLEAAAAGCAVITTDAIGCREAIIPGLTGELVPVRDVKSLILCLERFMNDRVLREKYGVAGRDLAINSFGVDVVVQKTLKIYEQLTLND